jgi:succinate-acetate transporter protein
MATANKEFEAGATSDHHDHAGSALHPVATNQSARLAPFGGAMQTGSYEPNRFRKFANPAPLGLSAFALTTFVLGLITMQAHSVTAPNLVVALAYGYGGLVQLLAGMWYVTSDGSQHWK